MQRRRELKEEKNALVKKETKPVPRSYREEVPKEYNFEDADFTVIFF